MKYLIVVDMQEDFVNGCLGSEAARNIVGKVEEHINGFDGEVIFTMDTHGEDYLSTQEGKNLPVVHCIKNTDGWQIVKQLQPYVKHFVTKPTFGSVALAQKLCELNVQQKIDSIELVGVCTSICVISNAMLIKAFLPEVPISVKADCCACVSEDSHNAALAAMQTAQINII
jgi:nicotinamidase-related amidase